MNKRCFPSDPGFIFIMRFLPSTAMYDRYCRREPVYFFIMCFYYVLPASRDHVWTLLSKRTSLFFLLCSSIFPWPRMHVIGQVLQSIFFHNVLPASHDHVWMHYPGGSVSFVIVLPASHDHVRMLLSKRSILYFYYVFPASRDHVWTFLSKRSGQFFFKLFISS